MWKKLNEQEEYELQQWTEQGFIRQVKKGGNIKVDRSWHPAIRIRFAELLIEHFRKESSTKEDL